MQLARRGLVAVLIVAVGACGGQPPTGPSGSLSAGSSGSSGEGLEAFKAGLAGLTIPTDENTNLLRDGLIAAFDLRGALGGQADPFLALVGQAENAALAELPDPGLPTSRAEPAGRIVTAGYVAAIPEPPKAPPPTTEMMIALPGVLPNVGRPGGTTVHSGPDSATATAKGDGLTAISTISTTVDAAVTGSAVTIIIIREVHSTIAEDATGAVGFDSTEKYRVLGKMDVCPSSAGVSIGRLEQSITMDATMKPGALGRVGLHATGSVTSTSDFHGQVDDAATLGGITQDYTHDEQWSRTAAAEGGPEAKHEGAFGASFTGIGAGTASEHEFSPTVGDFSKVGGKVHASGDATQQMIDSTAISAAWDFATIDQAFVVAQNLWRNSRCVVVAVPQYDVPPDHIVESEFEVILQGFVAHTEKVQKGSATPFEAVLRHRFGQTVTASLKATLNGKDKLEPTSIATPPGTLTYTPPNDDQKATVRMTSTSKQGIGILVIEFDTQAAKGLTGTITLVEDWSNGPASKKRRLTINVRLTPRAGFDGVTGWFDDNGSSYTYEGSEENKAENASDNSCFINQSWASTGSGPFTGTGRSIGLLIDPSGREAALHIQVQFATNYSVSTHCFGETSTTTNSEPADGWQPYCGANTLSDLEGTVGANGSINFSCSAPMRPGTGGLTVTGSLTRQ